MNNRTYDNDPSRSPRFVHGAGALLGMLSGLGLIGFVYLIWKFHPLATAWFGWH